MCVIKYYLVVSMIALGWLTMYNYVSVVCFCLREDCFFFILWGTDTRRPRDCQLIFFISFRDQRDESWLLHGVCVGFGVGQWRLFFDFRG